MANILRITQDYVILYKTIPENEGVLSIDAVFPPLMKGDLVEFQEFSVPFEIPKSLFHYKWVQILRWNDNAVGFVKVIYTEFFATIDGNSDTMHTLNILPEVVIRDKPIFVYRIAMDKIKLYEVYIEIKKIYSRNDDYNNKDKFNKLLENIFGFKAPYPLPLPPQNDNSKRHEFLQILYYIHYYHTMEDFTYILQKLQKENILSNFLIQIGSSFFKSYPETLLRILFFFPLEDIYNAVKIKNSKHTFLTGIIHGFVAEYSRIQKRVNENTKAYLNAIDVFTSDLLKMRFYQLESNINENDDNGILIFLEELEMFVDITLELFFATEITNEYLIFYKKEINIIPIFYTEKINIDAQDLFIPIKGIQKGASSILDDFDIPPMTLKKSVDEKGAVLDVPYDMPLSDAFDYKEKTLKIFPKMQTLLPNNTQDTAPKAFSTSGFVRSSLYYIAESIKFYALNDWPKLLNNRPYLLPMLNKVIRNKYQREAYNKVSKEIKGKITKMTNIANVGESTLNKINWVDLSRIWYYQLGNLQGFGGRDDTRDINGIGEIGTPIVFRQEAYTTQQIRKHPFYKLLHEYTLARLKDGNTTRFSVYVKYDTNIFWSAVRDNDVTMNLLGSFTVVCTPGIKDYNKDDSIIGYKIVNNLTLESASRFSPDGVIDNQYRDRDTTTYIELGGNLYCRWIWTEPNPFYKK